MSKIISFNNLAIGSTIEEVEYTTICKGREYIVKQEYSTVSGCENGKYLVKNSKGTIKEITVDELMGREKSIQYIVVPLQIKELLARLKLE